MYIYDRQVRPRLFFVQILVQVYISSFIENLLDDLSYKIVSGNVNQLTVPLKLFIQVDIKDCVMFRLDITKQDMNSSRNPKYESHLF
jgi:hypothetical protein